MPITRDDRFLLHSLTRPDLGPLPRPSDEELIGLITRCQAGDKQAGEQVLRAMAFPLAAMARRSVQTPLAHFVSCAWFVVAKFNTGRVRKVMTNLVLDTLKEVTRERVSTWEENRLLAADPDRWPHPSTLPSHEDAAALAAEVIERARELELVDERTTRILQAVYRDGLTGLEAAARTGETHDTVRQRTRRARMVLREHAAQLVVVP